MITIPKIRRELNIAGAGPGYAGVLSVWVNPSRRHEQEYNALRQRGATILRDSRAALGLPADETPTAEQMAELQADIDARLDAWDRDMLAWWAETLAADADELREVRDEADPGLWAWITSRCREMIDEYRGEISGPKSRAGSGPSSTDRDTTSPS